MLLLFLHFVPVALQIWEEILWPGAIELIQKHPQCEVTVAAKPDQTVHPVPITFSRIVLKYTCDSAVNQARYTQVS